MPLEPSFERREIERRFLRLSIAGWLAACMATAAWAQKTLTWEEAKREFEAANPTLRAAQIGIQESRAEEITAFLRPNPDLTVSLDQIDPFTANPYRPFTDALPLVSSSYLIERRHKRE
jgi:cobalt-zinc-cadmium efflux system outer membrane protein